MKIITWNKRFIKDDGIYGSIEDLIILAQILRKKLDEGKSFIIDKEYSKENEAQLQFKVYPNDIDPASMDKSLRD